MVNLQVKSVIPPPHHPSTQTLLLSRALNTLPTQTGIPGRGGYIPFLIYEIRVYFDFAIKIFVRNWVGIEK